LRIYSLSSLLLMSYYHLFHHFHFLVLTSPLYAKLLKVMRTYLMWKKKGNGMGEWKSDLPHYFFL
jgi:hypothetical protein